MLKILDGEAKEGSIPPFWDGQTAERICAVLLEKFNTKKEALSH